MLTTAGSKAQAVSNVDALENNLRKHKKKGFFWKLIFNSILPKILIQIWNEYEWTNKLHYFALNMELYSVQRV